MIPAASSCMSPITNMDILPTLSELIGFELPTDRKYDGVSVLKYINDTNQCNDRDNDPHEFTYYWRCAELYAIRYKQYKAHWITRNGFGKEPPIYHDPPILFNIEWDVSESIRLNTSNNQSEYGKVLGILKEEYIRATNDVYSDLGVPGFNAQDWFVVPCCNQGFNYTQAKEFIEDGDDGLAVWDECCCNYKPQNGNPFIL